MPSCDSWVHLLFKRFVAVPHGKRPLEQIFHQWQRTLVIPLKGETRKYFQLHLITKLKTIMPFLSADKVAVATTRVSNFHGWTDGQEACCTLYNFTLSFMEF